MGADRRSFVASGYWRDLDATQSISSELSMSHSVDHGKLAGSLERGCASAIKLQTKIVRMPVDINNAGLLRAQVSAAQSLLAGQLRADEAKLRIRSTGDVLERLEKLIAEQKKLLPSSDFPKPESALALAGESVPGGDIAADQRRGPPVVERNHGDIAAEEKEV